MAKKFTFRLETLLKLRRLKEEKQKRVVAERLRQIAQVKRQIDVIETQIVDHVSAMRSDAHSTRLDVTRIAQGRHWLTYLQRGRLEAETHLGALETRLVQDRALLAHASKEKKIFETLKERLADRHRREIERAEQIEADDLTTARYVFAQTSAAVDEP
jgi:flagellar export protein FliJ